MRKRLLTNSGLLGGARALSALMGLASLIIAAHTLDNQAAFGTLLFIHAYMLFFSEVASMQLWQAIIRFGADDVANDNPESFGALVKTGVFVDAVSALAAFLLAITCFGLYFWFGALLGIEVTPFIGEDKSAASLQTMIVGYCLVLLFRQVNVSIGVFRLFDKFNVLAARALIMPTVRLIGVILGFYLGWGLEGLLCVWFAASFLSYIMLQILAMRELLNRNLLPYIAKAKFARPADMPELYPFAIKCSVDSTLNSFKAHFPSVMIMALLGPATVAIFRIAEEISRFLSRAVSMFDQVLLPELAKLAAEKKVKALLRLTSKTALYIGLISFAISGIVLIWGEPFITKAFKGGYEDTPLIAAMLLLAASILSISIPFVSMLYMLKRPGQVIFSRIIGIAVYLLIFGLTFNHFGIFAAAWAAIGSAFFEIVFLIYKSLRVVKLPSQ